ncbi:hypothetical protein RFI_09835 [Reticulomyxa filosa]|uniref:Band 7 domain-containing protein n=1 Tax=Reticulomyxa filosa TaxID=46433 RepID=X6NLY7_RETFI|nr:hypothetical protein RFI_09835 [Reticulomyxa filosa]|eukprot:ETO27300.1 hypothetical protein RFI_09835 [Reticulomyxa filosa]
MFFSWLLVLLIPIFWFFIIRTVRTFERAVIFRLGKITGGAKGPGVFLINPCLDDIRVMDLRIETFNLPPQEMMTKDSVTVHVDAVCFMKVVDPVLVVLEVDNYKVAFNNFAATTLRSVVGTYDLQQLLSGMNEINERIRVIIEQETSNWGVAVPAVEIKDVKLPQSLQRAMAALSFFLEAEAERERRAKIISARGESESAHELARAADTIAQAPGALQLRYLHTLTQIAAENNSTIVFPLPMELLGGFMNNGDKNLKKLQTNASKDEQKEDQQ